MSIPTLKAIVILTLAIAFALTPAQAQSGDRMTVSIPFAFVVGDETMDAGTYVVGRTSQSGSAFLLRNVDGESAVAVLGAGRIQDDGGPAAGRLVFYSHDGEHHLAQIWLPASQSGTEVSSSELKDRLAGRGAEPELVAVIAARR